jgi:hypothetical protein
MMLRVSEIPKTRLQNSITQHVRCYFMCYLVQIFGCKVILELFITEARWIIVVGFRK